MSAPATDHPRPQRPDGRTTFQAGLGAFYAAVFFVSPFLSLVVPPFGWAWAGGVLLVFAALLLAARWGR